MNEDGDLGIARDSLTLIEWLKSIEHYNTRVTDGIRQQYIY